MLAWLRAALLAARIVRLVSTASLAELVRVLSYERLKLTEEERGIILTSYMEHAETLVNPRPRLMIPQCRDPHDEAFRRLAYAAKADALVTGDRDLPVLADVSRIPILAPAQFGYEFIRPIPSRPRMRAATQTGSPGDARPQSVHAAEMALENPEQVPGMRILEPRTFATQHLARATFSTYGLVARFL